MKVVERASVHRFDVLRLLSRAAVFGPGALVATLPMQQSAMAGDCTPGPTSVCSGPASGTDTTQIIDGGIVDVRTDPGFGLTVTNGGSGIEIDGQGGVTFTDNNASVISADGYGIHAQNDAGGDLTLVSTGVVRGAGDDGIRAFNFGADTLVRTHDVEGAIDGILVHHEGTGSVRIVSTGSVVGHASDGIYAYGVSGTGMTIEAADTHGASEGIYGLNRTTGDLVIISTGLATGESLRGILADNHGANVSVTAADTYGGSMGIRVNHWGTGTLELNSTGTARGGTTAVSAFSDVSSTSMTINSADAFGGFWGIYATHRGDGPVAVTSTGMAAGGVGTADGVGVIVETGAGSSTLDVIVNNAEGGRHGIHTDHGSAAGTPDNAATVTVSGHVRGGSGYGIITESEAGVLTTISVGAAAVVESSAGNGISNDDGDSIVVIAEGGTVNGRVSLGLGSDTIHLRGGLSGITVLDGGGGGVDVLNLTDAANASHAGSDLQN